MTRILLISHRDLVKTGTRFEGAFFRAIAERFDVDFVDWDDGGATESIEEFARLAGRDLADFDVCFFHVRFRIRATATPLEWGRFAGLRLWSEPDACQNFDPLGPRYGQFLPVFHRDRFDVILSTGREVTYRFNEAGVNACWVPKGYDEAVFFDRHEVRSGVSTFGTQWPSRRALLHYLARENLEVVNVSGPYSSLNDRLNEFAGALVCNMMGSIPFNRPGRWGRPARVFNRMFPGHAKLGPGIEPMAKTFEVAGAGCAPIVDAMDELDELGFVSGENCLIYRDFEEAGDILRSVDDDELRAMGSRAIDMARAKHTWSHRAQELAHVLEQILSGR